MREILFRGKEIGTNNWIYGFLVKASWDNSIDNEDGKPIYLIYSGDEDGKIPQYFGYSDLFFEHVVLPDTIGQYTGLKDKNGKMIFEGDIVYASGYSEQFVYAKVNIGKFSGGCETCCCTAGNYMGVFLKFSDGYEENILSDFFYDIEVVDNIHDNPELMENL